MDNTELSEPKIADSPSYFRETVSRIREGDEEALWMLVQHYEPHMKRVIRRKLNPKVRKEVDSVDFVQMVWASFFVEPEKIHTFDDPKHLLNHLLRIASNKVIDEYRRRLLTKKNGDGRASSIDDSVVTPPPDERLHTPSQYVMARERWDCLMSQQSQRDRDIVRMRMRGETFEEIADRLDIGERTARRVIERLLHINSTIE